MKYTRHGKFCHYTCTYKGMKNTRVLPDCGNEM